MSNKALKISMLVTIAVGISATTVLAQSDEVKKLPDSELQENEGVIAPVD